MVAKKKTKKVTSELEDQIANSKEQLNEEFFEAHEILKDNDGNFSYLELIIIVEMCERKKNF